ncbi:hypothetical protein JCM5296_001648 [Sporobolomyces johnsonii]
MDWQATQPRALPTSNDSHQPSPSKRPRVETPLAPAPAPAPPPPPSPPLRPLPAPVALLAVAHSLRSSAHSLLPALAKPPHSVNSHARYARAWNDYYRLSTAAIVLLRAAVKATAAGEWSGARLEIRANAELAEALADLYEGSPQVQSVMGEAERAVARAQAVAQKHPSLAAYLPSLTLLEVRLALLSSKPSKYARNLLKRLLATRLLSLSPSPPSTLAALYATHAALATLPNIPYAERIASWNTVVRIAQENTDEPVRVLATLAKARLALEADDGDAALAALDEIRVHLGPDASLNSGGVAFVTAVKVEFRLIEGLRLAQAGEVKAAKEMLKTTHHLLDAPESSTPAFNNGAIPVVGRSPAPPAFLRFELPTQSDLYAFTYLASAAIHRDPYGKTPRSLLFVEEGIRTSADKLEGRAALLPIHRLSSVPATLTATARLKVHLHIFAAELAIMRSALRDAQELLKLAITTARAYGVWEDFAARLTLDMGLLRVAEDEGDAAGRCFEAVIGGAGKGGKGKETASGGSASTVQLAELSLLLLKMSAGEQVLLPSSSRSGPPPSSSSTPSSPFHPSVPPPSAARLEPLVRSLTSSSSSSGPSSTPAARFIAELVHALTLGEITKSKAHLSGALNLTTQMGANHARALVLALLANLFTHTRNKEALKMLSSAYRIAQNMGGRPVSLPPVPPESESNERTPDEVVVGSARLGLWLGERLLEAYRGAREMELAAKQERMNEAHRAALSRG